MGNDNSKNENFCMHSVVHLHEFYHYNPRELLQIFFMLDLQLNLLRKLSDLKVRIRS